jgi:CheY-like chemotaxis protein
VPCKRFFLHRPDLILLGTILPRGDAFRLHQWLKGNPALQDIPHFVLDASPENHLTRGWRRDEGMQVDAVDYVCKPIKAAVLAEVLWKTLNVTAAAIKVLIADDHALVREGIRTLLNVQKDIYIVGEATNGAEAVSKVLELLPDVVLMDIVMPEIDGIEATRQICSLCQEKVKVLMLSQYDDDQNLSASSNAGALGFISKKSASTQLLEAVRAVGRGGLPDGEQQYAC